MQVGSNPFPTPLASEASVEMPDGAHPATRPSSNKASLTPASFPASTFFPALSCIRNAMASACDCAAAISPAMRSFQHSTSSVMEGWFSTCWYSSVISDPLRFHLCGPTICTRFAWNAFAVRTMDPMLKSCVQFSTATSKSWRPRASRSALMAATAQ